MKNTLPMLTLIATLMVSWHANAEVQTQSEQHFSVKIESVINAPVDKVYRQFLNVGEWWDSSHTWFGDASKMYIESKAGGCFCEVDGDQQALHMTVTQVNPNKNVQMSGGLGPLQSMGLYGHMSWSFDNTEKGFTKLTLTYIARGFAGEDVKDIANAVDGVLSEQVSHLNSQFN
ncbi:SRPBCC family protein [Kangiella shandongensis]|uniref:SRPBCC family protein n=1 Tax=Kangiella shandongensis TaxID=2763258 RepID=UPI001CC163E7|nr:SRPBCC family protein [Kangiella shandongensis]